MPEYKVWAAMKQRCQNPRDPRYHRYGGRGITVCPEWCDSFDAFLTHIGPRPSKGYQLDRIDNDGCYEPGNVRWATPQQQALNRSTSLHSSYMKSYPYRVSPEEQRQIQLKLAEMEKHIADRKAAATA